MDHPPPPTVHLPARTLTDLNSDTLSHCASFLGPRDLANMAMTSKALRSAAYSDSVWRRLFWLISLADTSLLRSKMQSEDNVLVTASSDRSICLWWKRCFRGHSGPVTTLADRLLGDCGSKVLASGGEDCTVRLWSVRSTGKHHPLTATYFGHEKTVCLLSVAGHKPSLLVSISTDSRVSAWDTLSSSSSTSSSCVGKARLCGPPVGMKCHDSQCYVAAGSSSVVAIDLRTIQKVATVAVHSNRIYSFELLPSKW